MTDWHSVAIMESENIYRNNARLARLRKRQVLRARRECRKEYRLTNVVAPATPQDIAIRSRAPFYATSKFGDPTCSATYDEFVIFTYNFSSSSAFQTDQFKLIRGSCYRNSLYSTVIDSGDGCVRSPMVFPASMVSLNPFRFDDHYFSSYFENSVNVDSLDSHVLFAESENQDLMLSSNEIENLCLVDLEQLLQRNGKSLKDYSGLPFPSGSDLPHFENVYMMNELSYDVAQMKILHDEKIRNLNNEQLEIYNTVVDAVYSERGGFFFVYGFGGIGKTYLWNVLSYRFRSERRIVLNVASSGISSLLLPGGRTAHSIFSIPLNLNEESCCNIRQGSHKADLIQNTSLIIWDEAPMVNKWAFEALDRTLHDLMRFVNVDAATMPFGGKTIVLGGDFRQILPVVPRASRVDIVMATVNSSLLWKHCKVLCLSQNMILQGGSGGNHHDESYSCSEA
ncbi:hypothetical protein RIF29_28939 [Crotalaria pallida]|uniref:ATP-dependent DNA helicase n=1 Tax=Crotalaria pallida TaxID=3830 RepID=A0AAN9EFZ1_CROPI